MTSKITGKTTRKTASNMISRMIKNDYVLAQLASCDSANQEIPVASNQLTQGVAQWTTNIYNSNKKEDNGCTEIYNIF